jgi:hypothetical protein
MSQDQEPLRQVATNLCWWQPPEVTLSQPRRFLTQVMVLGTWQEVQKVVESLGWDVFKDALVNAPAGVFDVRSWAYWRAVFGLPEAELPRRSLT